jgi:uncharacterized protein (UPF0332 family)/predicted nucleotidyltransferase
MNSSTSAIAGNPIAQRIKQAVLAVEPGATILLYGSRARGDARPDSDWDVLVLVDGAVDGERRSRIHDAVLPIDLETNVEVNVMTRSRSAWSDPKKRRDWFQINVERDAVPLTPYEPRQPPATEEEMAEARERTVGDWLRSAGEALKDAEVLASGERWSRCVSALYYSAFYAVTALLLQRGLRFSRHAAVQGAFNAHFGRTGIISPDLVDLYNGLYRRRRYADYDPWSEFTAEDVRPLIDDTRRFLSAVERLLAQPPQA